MAYGYHQVILYVFQVMTERKLSFNISLKICSFLFPIYVIVHSMTNSHADNYPLLLCHCEEVFWFYLSFYVSILCMMVLLLPLSIFCYVDERTISSVNTLDWMLFTQSLDCLMSVCKSTTRSTNNANVYMINSTDTHMI